MVELISLLGLERALVELNGMFAITLIDKYLGHTFLVRDRFGVKPLYYTQTNDFVVYGSELSALTPFSNCQLNTTSLYRLMLFWFITEPQTIYDNIFAIKPAHILQIDQNNHLTEHQWWSPNLIQVLIS